MKQHTTNYYETLIMVSDDTKASRGIAPPASERKKTIANLQFDLLRAMPLMWTSDDILFQVYALRQDLTPDELLEQRTLFFSKGQPCLRTSPLAKTYGWGIYANADGKVKLVDCSSEEYQTLLNNTTVAKVPAMRSARPQKEKETNNKNGAAAKTKVP
ncbi:DUF6157 family protein [Sphingobacterium suaedae]|uniref:DUF6157 family protein n=1 Tax=Sphingobacterium suaedae TaxID=1686402 RepID=A0ABW5KHY9_9SPHI